MARELTPLGGRRQVSANALLDVIARTGPIDAERLRADLDASVDQTADPRA